MLASPLIRRKRPRFVVLVVVLLMASAGIGCGVYQAGIRTGPSAAMRLPPTDPASVRIFGGESASLPATEVGFVVGVAKCDEEDVAVGRVRAAAAALGADALVDLRFEIHQDQLVARGRAVRLTAPIGATP